MDLYFAPLACSMASRIALNEAGAAARFHVVDIHTSPDRRPLADGGDYFEINPMGQVPALRTDDGVLITENPVVLQFIADAYPKAALAPAAGLARYRVQEWLNFIATELHKATFIPLFGGNDGAKAFARGKMALRFGHLERHLKGREFLLDQFTIADAYLVTVLNWAPFAGVDLAPWPVVTAYYERLAKRPSVAAAITEETRLRAEALARRTAA